MSSRKWWRDFPSHHMYKRSNKIQKLASLVPDSLKPLLRPLWDSLPSRKLRSAFIRKRSREELHTYWRKPWDGLNLPQDYLGGEGRSKFLVRLVKEYANPQSSILEIGCNVGRNLNYLYLAGFEQLAGIEISEEAVTLLKQSYPEMVRYAKIINEPAEEALRKLEDSAFDVIFTMAVLEHIHPESKFIFPEMVRITKGFLITIEDERGISWRHFPRNYRKVFEPLGLRQVYKCNCHHVTGLGRYYVARVFKKQIEGV